jgi:error-prone DNA polymerase
LVSIAARCAVGRRGAWGATAARSDLPLFADSRALASGAESEPDLPPHARWARRWCEDYPHVAVAEGAPAVASLRDRLAARGVTPHEQLASTAQRAGRVRVAGLVLVRQRPGTAKGVIFMTLEDETGHVANVIVWPKVFEAFRAEVLGARLVRGRRRGCSREAGVVHVVARRLHDLTRLLARLSRDHGGVESLAPTDEVKRPVEDGRGARRPQRALTALLKDAPETRDDYQRLAARASRVLPKGRNFR